MHGQWDWMRDPDDPLHDLGVGQRLARGDVEALAQRAAPHVHERHRPRQRPRLRDHARRRGPAVEARSTSRSRCGTAINACFFQYGIAAYDLEVGKYLAGRKDADQFWTEARSGARARSAGRRPRDYVVHPLLSGPSALTTLTANAHRQPRPQRVDALGHHVRPLPRGRRDVLEDLDRGRDPRRVVPAPDARLGQHRRQPAAAPHDRQPVVPDRAPPLPGPAEQPLPGDRAARCRRSSSGTG